MTSHLLTSQKQQWLLLRRRTFVMSYKSQGGYKIGTFKVYTWSQVVGKYHKFTFSFDRLHTRHEPFFKIGGFLIFHHSYLKFDSRTKKFSYIYSLSLFHLIISVWPKVPRNISYLYKTHKKLNIKKITYISRCFRSTKHPSTNQTLSPFRPKQLCNGNFFWEITAKIFKFTWNSSQQPK